MRISENAYSCIFYAMNQQFRKLALDLLAIVSKLIRKKRNGVHVGVTYMGNVFKIDTAQKMKFSIKDFFIECDQIRRQLRIWSHLIKKSLMENFIFCVVR